MRVDRDAKGNLIVSGQVQDRTTAEGVLSRVRALAGPYLAADGKVIDRIETATVSQVDVKVYIMEVDETALRQLGVNLQSATFHPDGTYTLGGPQFPVVESPFGTATRPGVARAGPRFHARLVLSHDHAGADGQPASSTTGTRSCCRRPTW